MKQILMRSVFCALAACGATGRTTAPVTEQPAPDFTAKQLDGSTFQLSALRGRVVILDVWAAWCDGCEEELPVLDELATRLAPIGATVVSVSIDEDPEAALRFLRARSWKMTAVYDSSGKVADAYSPPKMPAVFIIDRNGMIRDARYSLRSDDLAAIEAHARKLSQ